MNKMNKKLKEKILKESKTFRIWSLFEGSKVDLTMTIISKRANVSREKTYEVINWMLKNKLTKETRKIGTSRLFRKSKK